MNKTQPTIQRETTLRVQQLAGWVFLNCARLEESLKALLGAMATAGAGKLVPGDAESILDGTRKLTSGMVYKEILNHIECNENWTHLVEEGLAARNQLMHHFRFSRWDGIRTAEELKQLEAELKPLVLQTQRAVEVITPMVKGVLLIIMEQSPKLKTEEWQRIVNSEPKVEITHLPRKASRTA